MSGKTRSLSWYVASLFMLTLFMGGTATILRAQDTQVKLSHKQVKELIANAKEPADHEKLAAYYRSKAEQAKAAVVQHQEMLDAYSKAPWSHPVAKAQGGPVAMCQNLIRLYEQEEKANSDLAAYHDQMAKEAEKH